MIARRAVLCSMFLAFVLGGDAATALAKPTPVPGGANQLSGVSGTLAQTLFNGTLRLHGMSLKDAGPADNVRPNAPGERALVFRAIVNNGTHHEDHGYFDATLADADGITVLGRPLDSGWSLEPGAAARVVNGFSVPAGFVPAKLLLVESAHPKARAFRITLKPGDLPAAPAAPGRYPLTPPPSPRNANHPGVTARPHNEKPAYAGFSLDRIGPQPVAPCPTSGRLGDHTFIEVACQQRIELISTSISAGRDGAIRIRPDGHTSPLQ